MASVVVEVLVVGSGVIRWTWVVMILIRLMDIKHQVKK